MHTGSVFVRTNDFKGCTGSDFLRRPPKVRKALSLRRHSALRALPDEDDMAELQARISIAREQPTLPFLVIDSMVPGQRLEFQSKDQALEQLMEQGEVGVLGATQQGQVYPFGVTGTLRLLGPFRWELQAGRHIKVLGPIEHGADGVSWGKAEFVKEEVTLNDEKVAETLGLLVQEWRSLVEGSLHERFKGQIQQILGDIGPMPAAADAGARALWVAALVNPLPGLGVAYEIRPSALSAKTVSERLEVVVKGIRGSIGHVSGKNKLF